VCYVARSWRGPVLRRRGYPLERILRSLRVHQILEGTNEIMRVILACERLKP
jgi:alkylation response protein AidB-like acyl-CoA dehydrogenase